MTLLAAIRDSVEALEAFAELDVPAERLPESAGELSDASVRELLAVAAGLSRGAATLQAVLAGVAARRSGRDRGHKGFAAETGHRSPVQLVQELTGSTKGEANRLVRVGEALVGRADAAPSGTGDAESAGAPLCDEWHRPLGEAVLAGALSTAQHHAIRFGLGTPPSGDGRDAGAVARVWRQAAVELAAEARDCTVEELGSRARGLRDMLDPATAEERFAARFAQRSMRWSTGGDGLRRASIVFDDEMAAWLESVRTAALSPRRGGPRFVAEGQKRDADALVADPRTAEQLEYDLFVDLIRTGAVASADEVFGAREAGVRLVAVRDQVTGENAQRDVFGRLLATAQAEDGSVSLPGSALDRALCTTGALPVTVDRSGRPLDVGRESRLFTARQRVALAIRDGGCVWPGCDRPPSMCEAHHCDRWSRGGRTDCDVGVLLCRFHHLNLHHRGFRITAGADGRFVLDAPAASSGERVPLRSRSPLRWLWDPPPERGRWREGTNVA